MPQTLRAHRGKERLPVAFSSPNSAASPSGAAALLAAVLSVACPPLAAQNVQDSMADRMTSGQTSLGDDFNADGVVDAADLWFVGLNGQNESEPTVFTPTGQPEFFANGIITGGGSTINGQASTPLAGVRLVAPEGATRETINASIGRTSGYFTRARGIPSNFHLVLGLNNRRPLLVPLQVTVPVGSQGIDLAQWTPTVYRHDPESNLLELVQVTEVNLAAQTVTLETRQDGTFTWIWSRLLDPPEEDEIIVASYSPARDGFDRPNRGPLVQRPAEALAMAAYSGYYRSNRLGTAGLGSSYLAPVGNGGLIGQQAMVHRSFLNVFSEWRRLGEVVAEGTPVSPERQAAMLRNAINNTKNPVPLYLFTQDPNNSDAHSVLCYGFIREAAGGDTVFSIYDPDTPDIGDSITYDAQRRNWLAYDRGEQTETDAIAVVGPGSIPLDAPFVDILADANSGFNRPTDITVAFNDFNNGQLVQDRVPVLSGSFQGGSLPVTDATLFVNQQPYQLNVTNNTFSVQFPLNVGDNYLLFQTLNVSDETGVTYLANNTQREDFLIIGDFPPAVFRATLSWDTNGTDVDLYVTDPAGQTAWFGGRTTANGAELDVDNTSGFGPENITLTTEDTILYDGDYIVRVHYYRGNPVTNYTVAVLLYEGSPRQTLSTFSGSLTNASSGSAGPGGTGPAWRDITRVRLTPEPEAAQAEPYFQRVEPGELPLLIVPVDPESVPLK